MRQRALDKAGALLILCLIAVAGLAGRANADTPPSNVPFVDRQVIASTGTYHYEVFVPVHWDKKKLWPVILFLHGSGERGSDNRAETKNGIRLLIAQRMDRFPCVVVCPQCRDNDYWGSPAMEEIVMKELDQSIAEFNGNPNRLYLTGLSLGGYGVWYYAQKYPAKWAAIAPCCGGIVWPDIPELRDVLPSRINIPGAPPTPKSDPPASASTGPVLSDGTVATGPPLPALPPVNQAPAANSPAAPAAISDPYYMAAETVSRIPVWDFHGEADPTVPVSESRQMVALLLSMGGDVHYTEYAGVGHNAWDYAYKEPGLLDWFLSHKLR